MDSSNIRPVCIGFVVVNYNNTHYTRKFIESIDKAIKFRFNYHIVIVDNDSDISSIVELELIEIDDRISIIYNKQNVGYFSGLNIGINLMRQKELEINYILVGNNDITIDNNFFNQLSENIELFLKYPVVCPSIINKDGHHQNPHVLHKISEIREFFYDLYYSNYRLSLVILFLSKYTRLFTDRNDESHYDIPAEIYQGHGSCYMLGPMFFENFSDLLSPTFLMGEEFFLAYQLKQKNLKLFYCPAIKIFHSEHSSLKNVPSKRIWVISRESHKVYKKYLKIYNQLVII